MHGPVERVGESDGSVARQLPFDSDRRLQAVIRAETRIDADGGILPGRKRRDGRQIRIERRVVNGVLELVDAVVERRRFEQSQADAVVEHAEAAANDGLLTAVLRTAGSPREAEARRKIAMAADERLLFVTQPHAERKVRADAPVVLHERTGVPADLADVRLAGLNGEARRTAAERLDLRLRQSELREL